MSEFEKNPETLEQQPVSAEPVPSPEAPQQDVPSPEPAAPAAKPVSAAKAANEPLPETETSAEAVPDAEPAPDASSPAEAAESADPAMPAAAEEVPTAEEVPAGIPQPAVQDVPPAPPAYGMPPQQPYPYPPLMPNAYPQPPVKKKMPLGLKILIIVMIVLFAGSIIGFAVYGALNAVNSFSSFEDFDYFPGEYGDLLPEEGDGEGTEAEEGSEDATLDIPDIEVIPNTDGITLNHQPSGTEMDITDIYNKIIPSTVLVITTSESGSGTGTGIIATEDGYIITNSHVVLNTRNVQVEVKTSDGELHEAVVVGYDKTTDLAVLKIEGDGFTPAEFGNSDDLSMGQWVLAIGNPGGEQFSGSITRGIISGLDRSVGSYSSNGMTYIQTDAAINPGNSGGPLVNLYGQVVGINSAKIVSDQYEGMSFAIPVTGAKEIVDDLLSGGYVEGRVRFGIRGVAVSDMLTPSAIPDGFLIMSIDEDSSFAGTEVQAYDIITALDGVETPDLDALSNALLNYQPGDSVCVSVFRPNEDGTDGEAFEVTVVLLEDKGETQK